MDILIGSLVNCVHKRLQEDEEVSVEAVSKDLGYTRQYVSGRFHRATGHLLSRFLKQKRLEKAAHLLKERDLKVNQVSRMCGFDSENYFRQQFRNKYGMSPRQFKTHGDLSQFREESRMMLS